MLNALFFIGFVILLIYYVTSQDEIKRLKKEKEEYPKGRKLYNHQAEFEAYEKDREKIEKLRKEEEAEEDDVRKYFDKMIVVIENSVNNHLVPKLKSDEKLRRERRRGEINGKYNGRNYNQILEINKTEKLRKEAEKLRGEKEDAELDRIFGGKNKK